MANFQNFEDDDELNGMQEKSSRAGLVKGVLSGMGSMLQAEASVPSAYEYLYKKTGAPTDFQGTFDKMADSIQDPADRERKAMEYLKMKREGRMGAEQDSLMAAKKDPNSMQSKAAKQIAGRFGIQITPEMSAHDIEQMIDPKKMMEAEAQSRVNFENQKELGRINHGYDMQKLGAQNAAAAAKEARDVKAKSQMDPKKAKEFDDRYIAIMANLDTLDELVKADGTAELLGPHEGNLEQLINNIAIDSAKLMDPESVAREGEVAAQRKMLFEPGKSTMQDSTARGLISSYKDMLRKRAGIVRGDVPGGERVASKKTPQQLAQEELARRRSAKHTAGR